MTKKLSKASKKLQDPRYQLAQDRIRYQCMIDRHEKYLADLRLKLADVVCKEVALDVQQDQH